ncbi:MAG: efflux RND transporter periplasmic adaptor subunit [Gammaproteobacteria bacterium]|nr:efflux RND transporter periplasmic adaptor subunit [Gammaproteobacteria bacterium]
MDHKTRQEFSKKIKYKIWLFYCSYRYRFIPAAGNFLSILQRQVFLSVVIIFVAISFRYYILGTNTEMNAIASFSKIEDTSTPSLVKNSSKENALEHAKKHTNPTYVCPMHSDVLSNDPDATCPICGMDLVIIENVAGEEGIVSISPRVINMLGVKTRKVKKRTLYRRIDSVGNIKYDENKIRHIHLRTDGWVEYLAVKALGERVKKGDLLFKVYSPKLVNAQEELLQSLSMKNTSLLSASRDRLISLGMSKHQVRKLEKSKKVIPLVSYYAPQSGVVSELNIREGMFVKPSQSIISLVNMMTIWLIANIFENQAAWVKIGDRAEAELSFIPGKIWKGTVEHIYPTLDSRTRSLEVRLRFDNPDEILKVNMYADVNIFVDPKRNVLTIPRESLIRTGEGDRVIIALGDGKFKPVSVNIGIESNNKIEILNGLQEGDEVVISSQFLIDSESSLRASLSRLSGD